MLGIHRATRLTRFWRWVIICSTLLASVAIGCGGDDDDNDLGDDPGDVAIRYLQAWDRRDHGSRWDLLAEDQRSGLVRDEFVDQQTQLFPSAVAPELGDPASWSYKAGAVSDHGDGAAVDIVTTFSNGTTNERRVLVQEFDHQWRVVDDPNQAPAEPS